MQAVHLLLVDGGGGSERNFVITVCVFQRSRDIAEGITSVDDKGQGALIQVGFIAAVIKERSYTHFAGPDTACPRHVWGGQGSVRRIC